MYICNTGSISKRAHLYIQRTPHKIYRQKKKQSAPHLCILSVVGLGFLAGATGVVMVRDSRDLVAGALPGLDLVDIHPVKLLQGTVLTLNNEEVDNKDSNKKTARENISISKVNSPGDERGEETDEEVPKPVGCGRQSHTLCTVLRRVKFSNNRPHHRAPGSGIEEDEEAGDDHHALSGAGSVLGVVDVKHEVAEGGENHEEDEHAASTGHE